MKTKRLEVAIKEDVKWGLYGVANLDHQSPLLVKLNQDVLSEAFAPKKQGIVWKEEIFLRKYLNPQTKIRAFNEWNGRDFR